MKDELVVFYYLVLCFGLCLVSVYSGCCKRKSEWKPEQIRYIGRV